MRESRINHENNWIKLATLPRDPSKKFPDQKDGPTSFLNPADPILFLVSSNGFQELLDKEGILPAQTSPLCLVRSSRDGEYRIIGPQMAFARGLGGDPQDGEQIEELRSIIQDGFDPERFREFLQIHNLSHSIGKDGTILISKSRESSPISELLLPSIELYDRCGIWDQKSGEFFRRFPLTYFQSQAYQRETLLSAERYLPIQFESILGEHTISYDRTRQEASGYFQRIIQARSAKTDEVLEVRVHTATSEERIRAKDTLHTIIQRAPKKKDLSGPKASYLINLTNDKLQHFQSTILPEVNLGRKSPFEGKLSLAQAGNKTILSLHTNQQNRSIEIDFDQHGLHWISGEHRKRAIDRSIRGEEDLLDQFVLEAIHHPLPIPDRSLSMNVLSRHFQLPSEASNNHPESIPLDEHAAHLIRRALSKDGPVRPQIEALVLAASYPRFSMRNPDKIIFPMSPELAMVLSKNFDLTFSSDPISLSENSPKASYQLRITPEQTLRVELNFDRQLSLHPTEGDVYGQPEIEASKVRQLLMDASKHSANGNASKFDEAVLYLFGHLEKEGRGINDSQETQRSSHIHQLNTAVATTLTFLALLSSTGCSPAKQERVPEKLSQRFGVKKPHIPGQPESIVFALPFEGMRTLQDPPDTLLSDPEEEKLLTQWLTENLQGQKITKISLTPHMSPEMSANEPDSVLPGHYDHQNIGIGISRGKKGSGIIQTMLGNHLGQVPIEIREGVEDQLYQDQNQDQVKQLADMARKFRMEGTDSAVILKFIKERKNIQGRLTTPEEMKEFEVARKAFEDAIDAKRRVDVIIEFAPIQPPSKDLGISKKELALLGGVTIAAVVTALTLYYTTRGLAPYPPSSSTPSGSGDGRGGNSGGGSNGGGGNGRGDGGGGGDPPNPGGKNPFDSSEKAISALLSRQRSFTPEERLFALEVIDPYTYDGQTTLSHLAAFGGEGDLRGRALQRLAAGSSRAAMVLAQVFLVDDDPYVRSAAEEVLRELDPKILVRNFLSIPEGWGKGWLQDDSIDYSSLLETFQMELFLPSIVNAAQWIFPKDRVLSLYLKESPVVRSLRSLLYSDNNAVNIPLEFQRARDAAKKDEAIHHLITCIGLQSRSASVRASAEGLAGLFFNGPFIAELQNSLATACRKAEGS